MFTKGTVSFTSFQLLIFLKIIFECNCLIPDDTINMERPGKNLCLNHYEDVDCSNQVKSVMSNATCLMKHHNRTSTECTDSEFEGEMDITEEYGTVNLTPYPWFFTGFIVPALNITFTNIHWRSIKMRFVKVGLTTPQICREFVVSDNIDPSSVISFDCLWGNGTAAGEHYRFQYILNTTDNRKLLYSYFLQIPRDNEVDKNVDPGKYHMFIIMDQSAFQQISLKLLVPPVRFDIRTTNITLYYKEDKKSQEYELKNWNINITNKHEGDFIRVGVFDTNNYPGYYCFTARYYSGYCQDNCSESSTACLQISGLRYRTQVVIALLLLTISAFGVVCFLMWKNNYKKIIYGSEKLPKVLFVYESNYPSHIEKMYKFKEFLENNFYITTRFDLVEIPKTDSMNPRLWYYQAFEEVDYVLVFASPREKEEGIHEDNVYHKLHIFAFKLLIDYLLHSHRFSVASVKLPGCSWDTLPREALIIDKRFSLPEKLNHMIKFLNLPPLQNSSSKFVTAFQQPRTTIRLSQPKPITLCKPPFDDENLDLDDEVRQHLTVGGVILSLDGQSSSDEDEEFSGDYSPNTGLNL